MRILHVIHDLDARSGGPPIIAASLAAATARLGHEVTLLSYAPIDRKATSAMLGQIPGFDRVQWACDAHRGGRLERYAGGRLASETRRLIREFKPDVAHLHAAWEPPVVASARVLRSAAIPYLLLINGLLDPWSMSQGKWKKRFCMTFGWRRFFEGAGRLHLGNTDEVEGIKPLGLKAKGVIIPNGVWPESIEAMPAPGRFRARHPELADKKLLVFLSRLHFKKGLDYLIDAFEIAADRNPDWVLLIGGGGDEYRQQIERQIAVKQHRERIRMLGPVYGAEKFELLVDADVFCLTSRQEGFPMAVLDALAAGTACLISPGCHLPEVQQAGVGRVAPLDPTAIARSMDELLNAGDDRNSTRQRARALVLTKFNWHRIAEQAVESYQQVQSESR